MPGIFSAAAWAANPRPLKQSAFSCPAHTGKQGRCKATRGQMLQKLLQTFRIYKDLWPLPEQLAWLTHVQQQTYKILEVFNHMFWGDKTGLGVCSYIPRQSTLARRSNVFFKPRPHVQARSLQPRTVPNTLKDVLHVSM